MTFTRIPDTMERRHSGLYAPPRRGRLFTARELTKHPYGKSNEELKALIVDNPWWNPDLMKRLKGNDPDDLRGIPTDHPGFISPPRNSVGFSETLRTALTSGPVLNTFTGAVTCLNPTELWVVPANYFRLPGQMLRITVLYALSNIVTTPGTFVQQVMMGPTSAIIAFTTGNIQLNATAHTLLPAKTEIWLTLRAAGSGTNANFMGMGDIRGIQPTLTAAQVDAANTGGNFSAPATAPAVGTGWDSTVANILNFFTGFSISAAGNGITVHQYVIESLN